MNTFNPMTHNYDVLIIGSGSAGLTLALHLTSKARIAILSKRTLEEGASLYAQGGISVALDKNDSTKSHIEDTLRVGAGLCDETAARFTVEQAREAIHWLIAEGTAFTRDSSGGSGYHLTREGGHSHRRVIHAADATGRVVETKLVQLAKARSNIEIFENYVAIELITNHKLGRDSNQCLGAYALNRVQGQVDTFSARCVILATGGTGKVYLYTSNPDVCTGDGIAMGWRAGCRVANMEFIQFHPTCLYHPHAKSFLITEALRGEGGRLLLPNGSPFMHRFDRRGELAPRDIVARAIDHEMKRLGIDCVYLDISHKPAAFIRQHFPNVYAHCLEFGINITQAPIPVVPAAHYTCGGIVTDLRGQTDLKNLYAIGETAHTGLHGANRMASNSLLECLVFARAAAQDINARLAGISQAESLPPWDESQVIDSEEEIVVAHNWDELRRFMWDYVGIVRTVKRLQRAQHRIDLLHQEIAEYYGNFRITNDLIELRNLVVVADLIIRSALERKESRGLHYILDYPQKNSVTKNTVLIPPSKAQTS
ncbi:L-aspartate oxidase [Nitrosococcus oceani ATCC 19707]|uniref:L-aspartate oxidase n=2 Tax=Nitrosococcus oceani TaxID=1229 RepID=Q3J8C6_NITOC|nr:L-aspartate oxidase [Nitrosococcus oceani]ABA58920.1 L-aspartate oxidase [Nitrosococcus oceani ATCC 19707]EDZ68156.1 L-aspartate oxidase [Nitrosococcus oceani AFC27]GEM18984.1 L-aspartate oxidase [Nitrosococcus oceani]